MGKVTRAGRAVKSWDEQVEYFFAVAMAEPPDSKEELAALARLEQLLGVADMMLKEETC